MDQQRDTENLGESPIKTDAAENTRRLFLKKSGLATVPALLGLASLAHAAPPSMSRKPRNGNGNNGNGNGNGNGNNGNGNGNGGPNSTDNVPDLFSGWNRRNFQEIRADENVHVGELLAVLGANARPKPTFQSLTCSTAEQFIALSLAFENTGVGAYLQASYFINNPTYRFVATQIALVEAYHSGYLNTLANTPIVPNGTHFANGLSAAQVGAAVGPFIASLNGGPPATYADVQSDANDIAILNFALVAEYLEAEFYNINVPKFYA